MNSKRNKIPIKLARFTFDPLIEKPKIPKRLQVEKKQEDGGAQIIQFTKPLTREERLHIQSEYSLKLTDYIADFAYLEKVSSQTLEKLSKDPLFRAVVPYLPAFKIDPQIGKRIFVSERRRSEPDLLVMLVVFEDTNLDELSTTVQRLGFEVVSKTDEPKTGVHRLLVRLVGLNDIETIAQLGAVRSIEELGDVTLNNGTTSWVIQTNVKDSRTLWSNGLRGENQIIGHIDGAIDMNHCFFRDPANNTVRPDHRKVVGLRNISTGTDGKGHGTSSAGCAVGEDFNNDALSSTPNPNNGNAPRCRLTHGYQLDLDYIPGGTVSFYNYLLQAHNDGAHIHTNSWDDKSTSAYTQLSVELDEFTWDYEDDLVIIGPDNNGTIRPPDTSKNALVVNATQQNPNQNSFESGITMFTLDGRRKPDLMAPGLDIISADAGTSCGTSFTWFGTSFAAPAVAGAAALVRQYFIEGWYPTGTRQPHHEFIPTGALIKAILLNATVDMTNIAGYPDSGVGTGEGWGRLLLENTVYFNGDPRNLMVWDRRHEDGLTTGETRSQNVEIQTNTQFLKVTLAWTDPPGAAYSADPVVNNLDLEVVSPDGTQAFLGNVFLGGVSATGGSADTLNNVEMVLVNSPSPGDWTIRVIGTAVNVGNPGQGYALVVSADMPEPPVSVGIQDTLVVRAKFADIASEPSLPNLQNLMIDVANYVGEVSYGGTTVVPSFRGPVQLDHNKNYYYHPDRNLLIELTEEIVAKLVALEPDLFSSLERMVIVTNDINFISDWATTGPWPYEMPDGFTRPISVSVQSYVNSVERFTHGMLHQFGLVDLYAHEGVTFPRPYVDQWDNMAGLYNNAHPLIWSKERAGWLTAHGDSIHYIPRPTLGASYEGINPIPLFRNTSDSPNLKAIAIGLSQGAVTLASENVFYFVEARNNAPGTYDSTLPGSGVLIYYVNKLVPQGEGPVILRDKNLLTSSLSDAFFTIGDVIEIPGTGITITVLSGTGGADFDIQVDYVAPVTDYNVSITRGDTIDGQFYLYYSADIWIDSPKNGFNLSAGPPPHDQLEKPVAGLVNNIHARVHNAGPATAFDFDVKFSISEPWHTVGGEDDFDKFVGIKHINSLGPGTDTGPELFVEWSPPIGVEPHTCVRVDIINLVGTDTNEYDNWAQENLEIASSITASQYHSVTYNYNLTNPYDYPALFYFRAESVPPKWDVNLIPHKVRLNSGECMVGQAVITPPEDAKVCTSERIQVTSWTPRGDTLINVGGAVVQVDLQRPTAINLDVNAAPCDGRDLEKMIQEAKKQGKEIDPEAAHRRCGRISVHGCTVPPIPGQEIILKYVDPIGNVTYRTVKTDENGCFEDFLVSTTGGTWQVTAEYPGGKCEAPETEGPVTVCWCHN